MQIKLLFVVTSLIFGCSLQATSPAIGSDELIFTQEVTLGTETGLVWKAITQPKIVNTYYLAPLVKLELKIGGEIVYGSLEQPLISGFILDLIPQKRLQHSFQFDSLTHSGVVENSSSRVTYTLSEHENKTILTLTHDQFRGDMQAFANVTSGWPIILAGLKDQIDNTKHD